MPALLDSVREFISHQMVRLLESLPSQFLLDPQMVPAVSVVSTHVGPGVAQLSINNRTLTICTILNNEELQRIEVNLREKTLGDLISLITIPGVTFSLLKEGSKRNQFSALNLVDYVTDLEPNVAVELPIHTNPLWVLLRPMSWSLQDTSINTDVALNQLNLLKSKDFFADFWGRFLGIPRKANEDDPTYTKRIVIEILRPRDNNFSLEDILDADLALNAEITDLLPKVLQANLGDEDLATDLTGEEHESFIAGNVYNSGNFFVRTPVTILTRATTDALKRTVNLHKAAGTRAFFEEQFEHSIIIPDIGVEVETPDFSLFDVSIFDVNGIGILDEVDAFVELCDVNTIGEHVECCYYRIDTGGPVWTINETAMPGSKIVGGMSPFEYVVVCNPPVPPLGFNIVPLFQVVAEGWNANLVPLNNQVVTEPWEIAPSLTETWNLNIPSSTAQAVDDSWDGNWPNSNNQANEELYEVNTPSSDTQAVEELWES